MPNAPLSVGACGAAVTGLQESLRQLGFVVPVSEWNRAFLGPATRQAVQQFQKQNGLPATGAIDQATASAISSAVGLVTRLPQSGSRPSGATQPAVAAAVASGLSAQTRKSVVTSQKGVRTGLVVDVGSSAADDAGSAAGSKLNEPVQAPPQTDVNKAKIAALLKTSPTLGTNEQLQADFINQYVSFKGSSQAFWNQLSADPEFKAAVPELQFTLQLNALLSNSTPLISALRQQFQPTQLQDLTTLSVADWTNLFDTPSNGQLPSIPSSVTGATRGAQVANYVAAIVGQLKSAFPAVYIAQDAAVQPSVDVSLVNAVLAANPGLDPSKPLPSNVNWSGVNQQLATAAMAALRQEINAFPTAKYTDWLAGPAFTNPVRQWTATILGSPGASAFDIRTTTIDVNHIPALQQVPADLQGPVTVQLNSLQRLSRLTLDYGEMYFLQGNGMHSAFSVSQIPQAVFLNKYSASLGGRAAAQLTYSKAINVYAQVTNLRMRINDALNGVTPGIFGDISAATRQILQGTVANWTTLFGNQSTCQCTECRSLYGAAAYFVDLMQFLKHSGTTAQGQTPLDVLQGRRPDLWYLKLNCENTDTELPFVDLVNEILESYVYYVGTEGDDSLPQASNNTPSDATSDELGVNPEYTNLALYAASQAVYALKGPLTSAVYPFALPFNRFLETARVYFKNLNITRDELMQTFSANGVPSNLSIACECLCISPEELSIIDGTSTATLAELYGYPKGTPEATLIAPGYLGLVQNFLNATGLAYCDLLNLLESRFINPKQQVTLYTPSSVISGPDTNNLIPVDPCDLTYTTFQNLYVGRAGGTEKIGGHTIFELPIPGFLERVNRFVRLWRKTGWTMEELDKALTALGVNDSATGLGTGEISGEILQAIAQLKWLQTTLSLSVAQLLSLFSNLDVDGRDSLYISLFQNKAVISPVDLAFELTYMASLASRFSLQATWSDGTAQTQASYGPAKGVSILEFTGTMTDGQEQDLLAWAAGNQSGIAAVQNLFNQRWYPETDVSIPAGQTQQPPISANVNTILAALQIGANDLTAIAIDAQLAAAPGFITISAPSSPAPSLTWAHGSAAATEVVTIGGVAPVTTVTIGGAVTPGDIVTLTVTSSGTGSFGTDEFKHNVVAGDTLTTIAADLNAQINRDTNLSSLGISAVLSPAGTVAWWFPQATLTVAHLSTLYRYALLAQALNLSVEDLISLKALTGINPFQASAPAPATNPLVQFVKAAQMVAASNFSVAQLNYLYRALPDAIDGLPPQETVQQQLLASLSASLQKIAAADAFTPDPTGTALRKKLATILPADQIDLTMNFINGTQVYTSPLASLSSGAALPGGVSFVTTVTLGGTLTPGDIVTLSAASGGAGSSVSISYPVDDTANSIAADLEGQTNSNPTLNTANISTTVAGPTLSVSVPSSLSPFPVVTAVVSTAGGVAVPGAVTVNVAGSTTSVTVNGSAVALGNIVSLSVAMSGAPGFPVSLVHTVGEDTLGSIASGLAALINNNSALGELSAAAAGLAVIITSTPVATAYPSWSGGSGAGTETVSVASVLQCVGPMSTATQASLLGFSSDSNFQAAVNDLYSQAQDVPL